MTNRCDFSDLEKPVGFSGGLLRSAQPEDNTVSSKLAPMDQIIEAVHNKQQRISKECNNFHPKGLISTSQSNLLASVENQIIEWPVSRFSTVSKFVCRGLDNVPQSASAYVNSIVKAGNLSVSHSTCQNSRIPSNDDSRIESAKDVVITESDAGSSNVELKLGQPYQHNQPAGNLAPSVVRPKHLDTFVDPPKSFYLEQMIHNAPNYGEKGETRQQFFCAPGTSISTAVREVNQLNLGNRALGIRNFTDVTNGSVVPRVMHYNMPPERYANCNATTNLVSISEHVIPKSLHSESHTARSGPVNVPCNDGNVPQRQFDIPDLDFFRLTDMGKGVGCAADGSSAMAASAFKSQKQMQSYCSIGGGNLDASFTAVHDKTFFCTPQTSSMQADVFDNRCLFNYPGKVPSLGGRGHADLVSFRSTGSPAGSGKILQPQTVSMGLPSATKTSIPGLIPALSGQECPGESSCLLDDNMRLLALRQILELSKQHNAISSFGMNQEPGKFGSASTGKGQQSLIDLSAAGEQRCASDLTSKMNVSEVAVTLLPSGAGSGTGDPNKSAHVRGFSDWYNISTLAQGVPSCSLESHMPAQCSLNPLLDKQAKLRLGRNENLDQTSDHEKYCQRIPCAFFHGNSSCAAHAKCSGGNCEPRAGLSAISLKQQLGSVNCEASVLIASQSAKDHIVPKERTSLLDQMGKLQRRLPTGIVCHESRWRDVPSKHKRACDVKFMNQSADVLHGRAHDELQLRDPATKPLNESAQISDALKEQEMSNISSGCSAPAVTEASIEVNNVDSSTAHAGHLGYAGDAIVDEGSGIDKCWSSDDTLESEKSAELLSATCETSMRQEGSAKVISNQSSRTLLDELKLINSLTWKKGQSHIHSGLPVHRKTNHFKKTERHLKTGKRRREMKLKMLDESSVPVCLVAHDSCLKASHTLEQPSCSSKDKQMLLPSGLELYATGASSVRSSSGHGKSTFSLPLAKAVSRKRELHRLYDDRDGRDDYNSVSNSNANSLKLLEDSGRKKLRRVHTTDSFGKVGMQEQMHEDTEETAEYNLVGSVEPSSRQQVNACYRKARPIVCGEYGEISSGKLAGDVSRPVKFVSLSRVLKRSIRCTLPKDCKSKLPSIRELKKRRFGGRDLCFNGLSNWKKEEEEESHDILFCLEMNPDQFMEVATGNKQFTNDLSTIEREKADERQKNSSILDGTARAESRPKHKETRKRSLYELALTGRNSSSERSSLVKISKCMPKVKVGKSSKNADSSKCCEPRSFKINAEKSVQEKRFMSGNDRDAFCCVCGSSNNDEFNCLLECSHCIIRVHQACYGVSKVPKGSWYCRPCRTSSKDIVCVLCGYGGGAMTRALRSRTVVKSLLKARNIDTECSAKNPTFSAENFQDDVKLVLPPGSVFEDDSFQVPSPANTEQNMGVVKDSHCCLSNLKIHNSITAGAIDSTVKQWVHMVCGLWTPGTRCPNVDTMSAFDVSGASRAKSNEVCSMCNRPGGSCIQCRVMNCTVQFHPWCAHQKGLLQSEVEGVDNENVGFYGRCCLHATHPACESGNDTMETKMGCQGENQSTCARTEGYKGRKRDGFWHNLYGESRGKGGCFVPQEQLNAWIHINGQKSCIQGIPKLPTSIEYDCRKEYARYKQAKGWKHLVVYKSGIHALGLYTSRFISRGEMVVEYVGEVVGLRVADKREVEYQTGRKLQYKSACYFFRIDKEHIIDATLKGGIARFVNHSCLPNCVAKVISARNEKKVVFFAERDIYPGEEITYDYHFNHEDEGKKIPCFCNSKNCRRYLN